MRREWKPGDVAMIQPPTGPERVAILVGGTDGPCWHSAYDDGDLMCLAVEAIPPARPVIALDPEWLAATTDGVHEIARMLRAAFAPLAPPKPPEPTGWLAVVVDAGGDKWVRDGLPSDRSQRGAWWNHSCAAREYVGGDLRAEYADITAVRILSEGVDQ